MSCQRSWFTSFSPLVPPQPVIIRDGTSIQAIGKGHIEVEMHLPDGSSLSPSTDWKGPTGHIWREHMVTGPVTVLDPMTTVSAFATCIKTSKASLETWHCCLGHISPKSVLTLVNHALQESKVRIPLQPSQPLRAQVSSTGHIQMYVDQWK